MNHYRVYFEKGKYHHRTSEVVDVYNTSEEAANIEARQHLLGQGIKRMRHTKTNLIKKNINVQVPIKLGKTNVWLMEVVTDQQKSTVQNERFTVTIGLETTKKKEPMEFTTGYILSEEQIREQFNLTKEQFNQVAKRLPIFCDERKRMNDLHG